MLLPDVAFAESLTVDELVELLDDELPFVLLASLALELSLAEELLFETVFDEVEASSGVIPDFAKSELVESALFDDDAVKLSVLSSLLFEFVELSSAVDLTAALLSVFDEFDVLFLSLSVVPGVETDFVSVLFEFLSEFESEIVVSFADEELEV